MVPDRLLQPDGSPSLTFAEPVLHLPPDFETAPSPVARPLCFREVPWRWSDLAIGIAPLLFQRLLPYVAGPVDAAWQPFLMVFWIPLSLLPFAWMAAYPLWVAKRRGFQLTLPGSFRSNVVETGIALIAFPVVLILIGVLQAATSFVFGETAQPGSTLEPIYRSSNFNALVMTILAVSIGPVAEEIFFRGMLYNTLRTRIPVVLAVLIQAVVFAGMHPFDLAAIESIAVLGVAMGFLYEWRKTLISPIAYHAIQNLAASIVMISSAAAYAEGADAGSGRSRRQGPMPGRNRRPPKRRRSRRIEGWRRHHHG